MLAPSVLLVEDDHDVRDAIAESLSDLGYSVMTAENGRDALDTLERTTTLPSVILLDLMMPVMDGWEFRERQKKDERFAAVPVVVLTAQSDASAFDAAEHLRKPVALETLLATVARFAPMNE